MLQNYSNNQQSTEEQKSSVLKSNWWMLFALPLWVLVSFYLAQQLLITIFSFFLSLGLSTASINEAVLNSILAAVIYTLTLMIAVGGPWLVKRQTISWSVIGLDRMPKWVDILLTPAAVVIYLTISSTLLTVATNLFPGFDLNQVQDTGFNKLRENFELIMAFLTLVIVAPVAEEVLFRGYLYGRLKKFVPIWVAIVATSLLFGFVHGAWNLAIDTFSLSIVLCILREITGSIWSPILLHMTKNGIAFYILFISPVLLT